MSVLIVALTLFIFAGGLSPALAQELETQVDDVIVEARLSGAPTWEVTRGGSTVLLVGAIQAVPKSLDWRPDALEGAAGRADRLLYSQAVELSPGDVMRLIWRSGTLTRLPGRTTTADWLSPEWEARLSALEAQHDEDFSRQSFFLTRSDLLFDLTGLRRDQARSAEEVVRRATRRGRTPSQRVGEFRGDAVIDDLLALSPERWITCIERGIVAAEAGEAAMLERARAWRRFDVLSVMDSAIERALLVCWPWSDPEYGTLLRGQWISAVDAALAQDGTTLAVAPLRILAEPGGLLDDLERRGFEIVGPKWKKTQALDAVADDGAR